MAEPKPKGPSFSVIDNPHQNRAEQRAANIQDRFLQSGMDVVNELRDEVQGMPISGRFTDKIVGDNFHDNPGDNPYMSKTNTNRGLTEKEHKRAQLDRDLESVQGELNRLSAKLASVVMDIEATKLD